MLGVFEGFRRGQARARADYGAGAGEPAWPSKDGDGNGSAKQTLAEVVALAEELQARVDELEAEREAAPVKLLFEVLALPGVKKWLQARFHPDKHPDANEAERQGLTETLQKINAVYEIVERDR